jgi:alpha-beta hydrolase superfamily lysophospholipase
MDTFFKIIIFLTITSCTSIIYQPDKYLHANPNNFGIKYDEFVVPSFDGTKLVAWTLKSKTENPENLVLMFHGNAENMTSHFLNLSWLTDYQTDVMVFDYRGYGLSDGKPYPRGVAEDGLKFLQLAYSQFESRHYKRFIIYAQSLGGAILLRSLEDFYFKDKITLLVLDSTFRDPQTVAKLKTNWPMSRLISAEATADKNLPAITMPTLVIHSKNDPVIPYVCGKELFELIPTKSKWLWTLEDPGHGDVFFIQSGKYRKDFLDLLR